MWVFGQFGVQDALDQFIVTGGPLASVMGHKEIVAKQDDGGKEVTDTGLIVVTFHQLAHTNALELEIKDHKTNSLNEFKTLKGTLNYLSSPCCSEKAQIKKKLDGGR